MNRVSMSHLISFSRYQAKGVIKFLFRQLVPVVTHLEPSYFMFSNNFLAEYPCQNTKADVYT